MKTLLILKILEEYSNENNPLTQQQIIQYLKDNYNEDCDRRTVARRIKELSYLDDYDVVKCKKGTYLNKTFEDSDLRLLIDSILFSQNIGSNEVQRLIKKLRSLGDKDFKSKFKHTFYVKNLRYNDNTQVMYSVDVINEAINKSKKISFTYNRYERVNNIFQLQPKTDKPYKVNPYQMVIATGRYYLIANTDGYDNIVHYRIDKMTNVKILNESSTPERNILGKSTGNFNLPRHMVEHLYMFGGESVWVKFWICDDITDSLVDWFGTGKNYKILKFENNRFLIEVKINYSAMKFWAMQFGEYVEIVSPTNLRDEIKEVAQDMADKYSKKPVLQ